MSGRRKPPIRCCVAPPGSNPFESRAPPCMRHAPGANSRTHASVRSLNAPCGWDAPRSLRTLQLRTPPPPNKTPPPACAAHHHVQLVYIPAPAANQRRVAYALCNSGPWRARQQPTTNRRLIMHCMHGQGRGGGRAPPSSFQTRAQPAARFQALLRQLAAARARASCTRPTQHAHATRGRPLPHPFTRRSTALRCTGFEAPPATSR